MRKLALAAFGLALAAFAVIAPTTMASAQTASASDTVYVVKSGDTLSRIASAYGTTYTRLFNANSFIANPDRIYPGQSIRIPGAGEQLSNRAAATTASPSAATSAAASTQKSAAVVPTSNTSVWDRIAACESSGNWHINTGNGFYGGLQFTQSSWNLVGGSGLPSNASREEQISRAQALQAIQGWKAWPVCSLKAGMSY